MYYHKITAEIFVLNTVIAMKNFFPKYSKVRKRKTPLTCVAAAP